MLGIKAAREFEVFPTLSLNPNKFLEEAREAGKIQTTKNYRQEEGKGLIDIKGAHDPREIPIRVRGHRSLHFQRLFLGGGGE